jgi:valyl-tRNA synthetase
MIKPDFGQPIDSETLEATMKFFEDNLKLLHPFMPFITEEIWQYFREREVSEALIVSDYPKKTDFNDEILQDFEVVKEIISAIRNIRKEKNISFKESIEVSILKKEAINTSFFGLIRKLCNISQINGVDEKLEQALAFRVGANEFFIPYAANIDVEGEMTKIKEELEYNKGFLISVRKKLSNERFVNNAPEKVILIERKKEADALAKIAMLEESLKSL